jgi:hypothetical protein
MPYYSKEKALGRFYKIAAPKRARRRVGSRNCVSKILEREGEFHPLSLLSLEES